MTTTTPLTAEDHAWFDRFLIASVFGPPPEAITRAVAYVAALRAEHAAEVRTLREALMVVRTDLHRAPPAIEPAIRFLDATLGEKNDG